jgi:ribosomal protein S12 methylthiotransferase
MRSKAVGAILGEAQELAAQGVREIVLVAQHLTDYGRDLKIKDGLATLLDELCAVLPQQTWLRLMYAYPHGVTPRLIETMARNPQVCAYLDMPLQHAHPATLRRMRRPPDAERTLGIIRDLRAAMPDIALRSTFIVGYPGESEEEFQGLLDFVTAIEFDKLGAFRFSPEPGTPAATLPDPVAEEIKEERYNRLMELQQPISLRKNQAQVGKRLEVLVEGEGEIEGSGEPLLLGRSYRDAPEVDGLVLVPGLRGVELGELIQVYINGAMEYDLVGEPLVTETFISSKATIQFV